MKKIFYICAFITAVSGMMVLGSCEQPDAIPPILPSNTAVSLDYRLPESTILTAEEQAEVDAIRTEYEEAIK